MLDFLRGAALFVLPFLFLITVLVTFHEFGHFLVARLFGVKVERFSVGFGKALLSYRTKAGMEWRLGWMPIGGYVKFAGDANAASAVPDSEDLAEMKREIIAAEGPGAEKRYFHFKPVWQRALIVAAGPIANMVLSVLIFTMLAFAYGTPQTKPRIEAVVANSPAARAGFRAGDYIQTADGRRVESFEDLKAYIAVRAEEPIRFEVVRAGHAVTILATPQRSTVIDPEIKLPQEIGVMGLQGSRSPRDFRVIRYDPVLAVRMGVHNTWTILTTSLHLMGKIVTGHEPFTQMSGPIGMAAVSSRIADAATQGPAPLLVKLENACVELTAMAGLLSVGLGIANLLPIPVLDGGHLVFYAYEAVARRPLGARVQEAGFRVGLALLMGLMLFVAWNDLQKLSVFKNLGGLFS